MSGRTPSSPFMSSRKSSLLLHFSSSYKAAHKLALIYKEQEMLKVFKDCLSNLHPNIIASLLSHFTDHSKSSKNSFCRSRVKWWSNWRWQSQLRWNENTETRDDNESDHDITNSVASHWMHQNWSSCYQLPYYYFTHWRPFWIYLKVVLTVTNGNWSIVTWEIIRIVGKEYQ